MPKRELDSPITQIKLADFHVLKGDIYSAMELYKKKHTDFSYAFLHMGGSMYW